MQEFTNTPSQTPIATRTCILKKMIRFLLILPVINWRRFNGNRFDQFGDVSIWGHFDLGTFLRTHEAEPELRRYDELDFVTLGRKYPDLIIAPLGNLDSAGSEEKISIRPFIFRSKLVSMEDN